MGRVAANFLLIFKKMVEGIFIFVIIGNPISDPSQMRKETILSIMLGNEIW